VKTKILELLEREINLETAKAEMQEGRVHTLYRARFLSVGDREEYETAFNTLQYRHGRLAALADLRTRLVTEL